MSHIRISKLSQNRFPKFVSKCLGRNGCINKVMQNITKSRISAKVKMEDQRGNLSKVLTQVREESKNMLLRYVRFKIASSAQEIRWNYPFVGTTGFSKECIRPIIICNGHKDTAAYYHANIYFGVKGS